MIIFDTIVSNLTIVLIKNNDKFIFNNEEQIFAKGFSFLNS